jgi:DNA mismatch repair protein MSH5
LVSVARTRYGNGKASVASTPSSLSRSSHLSSPPPLPAYQAQAEFRLPFPRDTPPYRHRSDSRTPSLNIQERSINPEVLGRASLGNTGDEQGSNHSQDTLNEIIMAIDVDKEGKVGCAYYVAMDEALVLEEDIPMGGIEAVDTLLLRVQPTSIIIPNRAPGDLIEFLERDAHRFDDSEGSSGEQGAYILRHIVSVQFDYEAGKEALARVGLGPSRANRVEVLSLDEEPVQYIGSSLHNNLMRLAETINLDSCLSVGCAGAVLNDLERRRTAEDPSSEDEGSTTLRVRSIEMNTCADTVLLGADSLISLQILQSELHPNPQTRSSNSSEPKAKEALSITGLLQALASSAQGKRRLRQMLLQPSTDLGLIQDRHRAIEALLHAENADVVKNMRRLLRKLKNTKTLLLHVRMGVDRIRGQLSLRVGDWKALLRFAMVAVQLKQATHALKAASGIEIFSRVSFILPQLCWIRQVEY